MREDGHGDTGALVGREEEDHVESVGDAKKRDLEPVAGGGTHPDAVANDEGSSSEREKRHRNHGLERGRHALASFGVPEKEGPGTPASGCDGDERVSASPPRIAHEASPVTAFLSFAMSCNASSGVRRSTSTARRSSSAG